MRGYPQFSFWIPIILPKTFFSHIVINRAKNTSLLVGTVLKIMALDSDDQCLYQKRVTLTALNANQPYEFYMKQLVS